MSPKPWFRLQPSPSAIRTSTSEPGAISIGKSKVERRQMSVSLRKLEKHWRAQASSTIPIAFGTDFHPDLELEPHLEPDPAPDSELVPKLDPLPDLVLNPDLLSNLDRTWFRICIGSGFRFGSLPKFNQFLFGLRHASGTIKFKAIRP